MSVYNSERYLRDCIESVLNQTYPNFHFYIIDDKSTDRSLDIIKSYTDGRIKLIQNKNNLGLTKSLNNVLNRIKTKYIARIDADDICEPTRLSSQLAVFEGGDDNKLALVGSSAILINENGNCIGEIIVPTTNLKERLFFKNCYIHSTIMVRTEVLKKYRYDEQVKYAQDYNLWVRISHDYDCANLKERLIKYRFHSASVSNAKKNEQDGYVLPTINHQLMRLGISDYQTRTKFAELHFRYFVLENKNYSFRDHIKLFLYFRKVLGLNRSKKIYNKYFNEKLLTLIQEERGILTCRLKNLIFQGWISNLLSLN